MKKKWLSVAGLWLALIALVFIYTDRNEYTWRYEGDELGQIVISSEEADARQTQADAAMALEQQAAQARTDANRWGTDEDSVEPFRQAQNEDGGLNLTWGRYEVTVDYDGAAKADVRVVSAGYQAFIENGEVHEEMEEENGRFEQLSFGFNLTDSTPDLYLASENPEDIVGVTVHKAGAGVFSADLCAYAALVGAVLTVLLALSWDKTERGRKNRRDAMILVCAAAFACMPLLWRGVYDGHDLLFHLNRIEGIASGLRNGQFPVRIHSSTLLGYGYAAPEFYPELFLYFPAALRNLGVSLSASVRVFEACINLATALACYLCVRSLMRSRRAAVGASVLYTLCIYRLVNLYTRATLGESLAMIFFPIVLLGLYEVLRRNEKRWPLLALGMTGVCMSHLLSTLFCAAFCALAAVLSVKKLFAEKRRILAILLAAGVTGAVRPVVLCADDAVYGRRHQHERRAQRGGKRACAGQFPRRLCGRRGGGCAGGFCLYHRRGAGTGAAAGLRAAAGAALCGGARGVSDRERQIVTVAAGAGRAGAGAVYGFLPVDVSLFAQKAVFHVFHADAVPVALCQHCRAAAERFGGVGLSAGREGREARHGGADCAVRRLFRLHDADDGAAGRAVAKGDVYRYADQSV